MPYNDTLGEQAVLLYNQSGRTAMEWQIAMMYDIMALDDDELWTHQKFGYSVPRRNGKSELLSMRAIWGLLHGEKILYTAHRVTTSSGAWDKMVMILTKMGFTEREDFKSLKRVGAETIEMLDGDGRIYFRTRSSKGGLGEGFDLLIIDEAQEYTADQESALKYVVTDSRNPQTIMCGTPPTAVSSGTVFTKFRQQVLSGNAEYSGWAEWSVTDLSDTTDRDLWYETNPSLGQILTERAVKSELSKPDSDNKTLSIDDNIQRLGLWLRYNQKSAISKTEWRDCLLTDKLEITDKTELFYGVKFSKNGGNMAVAVAIKQGDKIFAECIDCRKARDGNTWLIPYFKNKRVREIVVDGANGQTLLQSDCKNAGVKARVVLPKVGEVIEANTQFEQALFSGKLLHSDQAAAEQAVSNCEHRAIGSGGGFGYTSILEGADIALIESMALAIWSCANAKEKRTQSASY